MIAEAAQVCRVLRLDHKPVIVFAGQGPATSAMLDELVEVLNPHCDYIHFAPRPHPRMVEDYASEVGPWNKALTKYRGAMVVSDQCSMRQMVAVAYQWGAVVSMYSTTLLEAAAARASAIAMLYPEAHKVFRQSNPGLEQFPLAELGCAEYVSDRADLDRAIERALRVGNVWREKQERYIVADGHNASRAGDAILGLL